MELKELKRVINRLELKEVVSSGDRKTIRLNEMIHLSSIKAHVDKLLKKAEEEYQSACIIDSEEMLKGNKGASTRISMAATENKFIVSIVLRDDSIIDLEGFKCMLEATDYADQIDYMLSSREGRKLLRQDLGRKVGGRA